MSPSHPAPRTPSSVMSELEELAAMDWSEGLPLNDLLAWVNDLASRLLPAGPHPDSRVSRKFSERSFRHYQTLRCIDPPERAGKRTVYGFRHLVQALLVRKLLWEQVPSGGIADLTAGRGTAELTQILFQAIEIVARVETVGKGSPSAPGEATVWNRIEVAPGIELHLQSDMPKPRPDELKKLLARLETALRRNV